MKVILIQDIPSLGTIGDVITVKDGYARNYLIPQGKAIRATTQNVKALEHQKRVLKDKLNKIKRDAEKLARHIENISCTVAKPVGEGEKLFGSVTSKDIEDALKAEGIDIDRKKILLDEPIKTLGVYTVPIKVHPEVLANLKVWVVKE